MSGYNKFEQAAGALLSRFPRAKGAVETVYQQASYRFLADSEFEYDVHGDVEIQHVEDRFGVEELDECFVGFYDVCPWNESMDRYLVHELSEDNKEVSIVVIEESKAIEIANSRAWNYQQGSRAQWYPADDDAVVFNDIADGKSITRVVDIDGEEIQRYGGHLQAMNPTGDNFLAVDYRRYDRNSPAYGYCQDEDEPLADSSEDGIVRVDTDGGRKLIVSFETLIAEAGDGVTQDHHHIHHALYAPDGDRFAFLHRWREGDRQRTRLCVSDLTGEVKEVLTHDSLSHFSWLDNSRLFLWGGSAVHDRGYHIVDVDNGDVEYVKELDGFGDGHPSVSPDGKWVVTDTYPDRTRTRSLWLYNIESERSVRLGDFFSPFEFDGPTRCDLHPRWSPDGRSVSVDSVHEGNRGTYIMDVSQLRE